MAVFSALLALLTWPIRYVWRALRGQKAYKNAKIKRVVILGLDGLEPTLAEQFMNEGKLPNLDRLRKEGCYTRLGTTWPPLSPVAWSSFSTGTNPGKHNIFDFIGRNPVDYKPLISSVQIRPGRRNLRLGPYVIPLSRPDIRALRKSKPFWTVLGETGIFSAVLRVPITFPPDKFHGVQLSAMCVPDLRGTQGMFSYYIEAGEAGTLADGDINADRIRVTRAGAKNDVLHSHLRGPLNPLRKDHAELRVPFEVRLRPHQNGKADGTRPAAFLHVNGQEVPLFLNRYTDWVRVSFRAAPGVKVRGICRFLLKNAGPPFEMYCTAIQLDPSKPAMPISHSAVYASYLAYRLGPYATLGLAEDTGALSEKLISEDDFLTQAYDIHAEREKMFFDTLKRVRQGLVVCVFDGPDRIQHMFWRFIDDQHPALNNEQRKTHRHAIPEMYRRMDDLVGRALAALDDDTVLFVMSDHGFKPFRRGVDLNAWLLANGYLKLKTGAAASDQAYFADVDWSATKAYAFGLAGLYINQKGREAHGIVSAGEESRRLVAELAQKLTGLRDPQTNEIAIHEAAPRATVYHGPYNENAPDLIIGYNVGYRVSWDAATGKCGPAVFADNHKAWSGDHCIHPKLVPGVLFSNLELDANDANIIDLAATTLDLFGVPKPEYMEGKSLLPAEAQG